MTVANAFIIGVNKAGTTAIFDALSSAEDVCASSTKEPHYFDAARWGRELEPLGVYEEHFSRYQGESVVLDGTPSYFYGGSSIAEAIISLSPSARAVLVVRAPWDRAYSWWGFAVSRGMLPRDLVFDDYVERSISLGMDPEYEEGQSAWRGLSGGHYAHWLPTWQSLFQDRLLVVSYDDLVRRHDACVEDIGRHFGVESHIGSLRQTNVTTQVRSPRAQALALGANRRFEAFWRSHPTLKARLRDVYYRANGSAAKKDVGMSTDTRRALMLHYQESLDRLGSLGVDIPRDWKHIES